MDSLSLFPASLLWFLWHLLKITVLILLLSSWEPFPASVSLLLTHLSCQGFSALSYDMLPPPPPAAHHSKQQKTKHQWQEIIDMNLQNLYEFESRGLCTLLMHILYDSDPVAPDPTCAIHVLLFRLSVQ